MLAIVSLLVILGLSLLITRIASTALEHTGLSRESARFQARSAFTGVGFTTNEAEQVVNHPVRRRIVLILMLLGNAGIVTSVSSLILSFVSTGDKTGLLIRMSVLAVGVGVLLVAANSRWVDARLSVVIRWALRRYTTLDIKDYASLLHLAGDYRISELRIESEDWLAGKTLKNAKLSDEGIHVLGVQPRKAPYRGALTGDTIIRAGDTLILYGRSSAIKELEARRKGIHGDIDHNRAVAEERRIREESAEQDSLDRPDSAVRKAREDA